MNWLTLVIETILIVGLCSANPAPFELSEGRIVGGFETTIEQIPWQVSVLYDSSIQCGGSIIGEKWVLTAAHCTEGFSSRRFSVRVGSSKHREGGQLIPIKLHVQKSASVVKKMDFDFLLLELAEPLNFTDQIQPIALADEHIEIPDGRECLVSGWGLTDDESSSDPSEQLRAVVVPIVNQRLCKNEYSPWGIDIKPSMICAGYTRGGKGFCNGDSGGLLVYENNGKIQVIGVVSFSLGCAEPYYVGVYSRISYARTWIKSVTGI